MNRTTHKNVSRSKTYPASMLRRAAHAGNLDVVLDLLRDKIHVDAPQADGCTAVWLASEKGHTTVVRTLCEHGADVNVTKHAGRVSPLYIAAQNGHLDVVRILLLYGASIDQAKSTGATPLFIAGQQNHFEIVQTLLEAGADIEHQNHMGITPLMIAAYQGNTSTVHLLLRYGADPCTLGGGRNAFQWAECGGHSEKLHNVFQAYQNGRICPEGLPHHNESDVLYSSTRDESLGSRRRQIYELSAYPNAFRLGSLEGDPNASLESDANARTQVVSLFAPLRSMKPTQNVPKTYHACTKSSAKHEVCEAGTPLVSTTCITPHLVQLEKSRQKYFHTACKDQRRKEDQASDSSEMRNPSEHLRIPKSLKCKPSAIEREWFNYKAILAARQNMLSSSSTELPDEWMFPVGHLDECIRNTNKARREEYNRIINEKQQQAKTLKDPEIPEGLVIPQLDGKLAQNFRSFLCSGMGAKEPSTLQT